MGIQRKKAKKNSSLVKISNVEYYNLFIYGKSKKDIEKAYQKAWEAKNFEIENYWKRTNYFWAFQVASFTGYFAVLGSNIYVNSSQVLYFVICIGLVTSFAWGFINKGSKIWQRHWEMQVHMLEDRITGPLYKISTIQKTFSVSKINELVSWFIVSIWIVFAIEYLIDNININFSNDVDWLIVLSTVLTVTFICLMAFGYGRGRFKNKKVEFYIKK